MNHQCKVCFNTQNNISYIGREMMFGTRDEFPYFKCSVCGCLQIVEIPANLEKYYPTNYYSYQQKKISSLDIITNTLIQFSLKLKLDKVLPVCYLSSKYKKLCKYKNVWLQNKWVNSNSSILDVGCGNGALLKLLKLYGFKKLKGIDPFLAKDIIDNEGINIYKKEIFDIQESFDFIMLHHSFEHMSDPHQVFSKLSQLITDKGYILIRIPIADGYAWRKYQMDWFQVDAPRHFFLHTVKSINMLAEQSGLIIDSINYDSEHHQLTLSEMYLKNIPLSSIPHYFKPKNKLFFKRKAELLNKLQDGDQACFILKKKIKA